MKKFIKGLLLIFLIAICTGCGNNNSEMKAEDGNEVMELAKPVNLKIKENENGRMLHWDSVSNAAGYRIFRGSSKYASDFTEITNEPVTDTEYSISTDYSYYRVVAVNGENESELSEAYSFENELFGKNTYIYSPKDDPEIVNDELHKIYLRQETAQFGKNRYFIMFKPGEYSDSIRVDIGFYMEVCGLGELPKDTILNSLNCTATWLGDSSNHNATCNFWRGVSNLTVKENVMWAVSQATFMRRMNLEGNLYLHDNHGWASGGFLADSYVAKTIDSGSQQQWLTRNSYFNKWTGENWNIVFVGDDNNAVPTKTWPSAAYTAVEKTPVIKEKPYLIFADGEYYVGIPEVLNNSESVSWKDGVKDKMIPLSEFYVAKADTDNSDSLNSALKLNRNILFTPGIYKLDKEITVTGSETVILGCGYATLEPTDGNICMRVNCNEGVTVAGLLFDAGKVKSENLMTVGDSDSENHSDNPILLSDLFFRVGGTTTDNTQVEACVVVNANNTVGDNFWIWRADHGDGVAWNKNTAENGIIVNGDDVTIYALMVEHFRKYQTVWNGNGGSVYFYQSELPYDVPRQDEWSSHDGDMHGYASYYISDEVKTHTAYGIGIYSYNRDAIVEEYSAMEMPECEGMDIHNVCAVMITGNPGISHVINGLGKPCYQGGTRSVITDFQKELNS